MTDEFEINFYDKEPKAVTKKTSRRRTEACTTRCLKTEYKRAYSESKLLDISPRLFKEGNVYNFITGGDIDALSFLKIITRQQNLDYCLFSTWVMACDDILQFEEWLKNGTIRELDAYVGEVFPNQYKEEWKKLKSLINEYNGRVAVFRNHSKIFAGYGEKYYFGVQTSANINTNPRTENACIQIGKDIFNFYKDYFDGINSFE